MTLASGLREDITYSVETFADDHGISNGFIRYHGSGDFESDIQRIENDMRDTVSDWDYAYVTPDYMDADDAHFVLITNEKED